MTKTIEECLQGALRQYRHNNDNSPSLSGPLGGFVVAYDKDEIDDLVDKYSLNRFSLGEMYVDDCLKPQQKQTQGAWTRIDEGLPESHGHYIVTISDPDDIGWRTDIAWESRWDGECFTECDPVEDGQPVVAWMKMPDPYVE